MFYLQYELPLKKIPCYNVPVNDVDFTTSITLMELSTFSWRFQELGYGISEFQELQYSNY